MDITKENRNPNPREGANLLSALFFTFTFGMFKKGVQKTLEADDLYEPLKKDRSTTCGDRLERNWNKHLEYTKKVKKRSSLLRVLVKTFWPEYLLLGVILGFMDLVIRLIQPLLLGNLLDYFRPESTMTKEEAYIYAGVLVASNALYGLFINQYIFGAFHFGMRIRTAICSLIYRKALKLSRTALGEMASAKAVNLLSNDVSRFDIVSIFIHHMWVAPVSSCVVTYFLWSRAGLAGVIGIVPVFFVVPLQSYTGKLSSKFRRQTAYKTDERVRLMDEIISGIQVIKMYAWEKPFEKLIRISRLNELRIVTKLSYVRGLYMTFNLFTTRVALFCSLITLVLSEEKVTAATVFVFMSYFNILSQTMSSMFVRGISEIAESLVAISRLQEFLCKDEFIDTRNIENNNEKDNAQVAILLDDITARWDPNKSDYALKNLRIRVPKGSLVGVIGLVGSGKSSFLQTLLGELEIVSGNINMNGKISYATQEPWVFAATIRQNITFGLDFNKRRYNEVIKACALEKDFLQFEDGDLTYVGERGASLSGGQKARINLARAVYREADIYLLDDPLSAVDVHVAKHLFTKCIQGYLKTKTRVLVTHQVQHLSKANYIYILKDGYVEAEGTFEYLANQSSSLYAQLLNEENKNTDGEQSDSATERQKIARQISTRSKTGSISSAISESSLGDSLSEYLDQEDEAKIDMYEESSKGKIKGSLFFKYLLAGGNCCFVMFVMMLYIIAQGLASGIDYFVGYWTNIEERRTVLQESAMEQQIYLEKINKSDLNSTEGFNPNEILSINMYLYIYTGLIALLFISALMRSLLFYKLAMLSSQNLHNSMFKGVVYSAMRFFDTNTSGRILNRFSKDLGGVDELLPKTILDAGQIILLMIGSLLLVSIINPIFLVPVAFISCAFYVLRIIFLKSSKNIKRLEGMMRSPVFTHLNASIQGLTTIRAFGAQKILKAEFDKHQDLHTSAWFMYIAASSAFGFYLDVFCFVFIGIVTFSFLTFGEEFLGGKVGLAITQASTLTGLVQWGMRQSAEVSNQLMSVERILEYTIIPEEQQPVIENTNLKNWPQHGKIVFSDVGLRYATDLLLTLHDLNLVINPKEKVGIVGRTGAGKSSLIAALFRLAIVEGKILIDGIDCESVNLQYLRSKISIIPQDPVLFSGTLRYNLDPFMEYNDEVLWKALKDVELKDVTNKINRLESIVMDRGSNYSVGQRQLICLARAIIRNNKILLLDEATANVDPQTDFLIQKTIRQKFANCTVLTIAHRLNTIMDSDKVLVMDAGTAIEFNHPHLLLKNTNSNFYQMVKSAGSNVSDQLMSIAKNAFDNAKPKTK